ncbi:hypothetical protein T4B_827 [Trichinella pseudospiralis]|uniref:Uncharacterized protein n=1 Tax=Trichinella pseudospiralis TaxID=6337 RepID=A0A0V1HGP1_TRIPS|nr:hypothetical protein T4A_3015 [Trichinella pseudospiralis]KRZ09423.1 hypothetical protein T4B_827 [Trichinella pseudospiralis]
MFVHLYAQAAIKQLQKARPSYLLHVHRQPVKKSTFQFYLEVFCWLKRNLNADQQVMLIK